MVYFDAKFKDLNAIFKSEPRNEQSVCYYIRQINIVKNFCPKRKSVLEKTTTTKNTCISKVSYG